jgi:hypothetical protein
VASRIDVVVCCTNGTDHINKATLLQLHASVPVLVRPEGVKIAQSWEHFDTVEALAPFTGDWRQTSKAPLPEWIGIGTLTQKKDPQTIHKGLVLSFDTGKDNPEAVIYTPHGILTSDLAFIPTTAPNLRILALLHGILNVKVGWSWTGYSMANLGAHNGLAVQRLLDAKYWLGTHDERKIEQGFTSLMLTNEYITVEDALEQEKREAGGEECGKENGWRDVGNGGTLVLA